MSSRFRHFLDLVSHLDSRVRLGGHNSCGALHSSQDNTKKNLTRQEVLSSPLELVSLAATGPQLSLDSDAYLAESTCSGQGDKYRWGGCISPSCLITFITDLQFVDCGYKKQWFKKNDFNSHKNVHLSWVQVFEFRTLWKGLPSLF